MNWQRARSTVFGLPVSSIDNAPEASETLTELRELIR